MKCHRAWYLKSRDQRTSLSGSNDGWVVSIRFTGDFVSVVSLWHEQAGRLTTETKSHGQ